MTESVREGASAILVSTDGRLLLQLRDDVPHITWPGKTSLFGGQREGDESFLECVTREIHEEIGLNLPPERFERIGYYSGPDPSTPNGTVRGEVFLARDLPLDALNVTEGKLRVVALNELPQIQDALTPLAKYALDLFLKRQGPG